MTRRPDDLFLLMFSVVPVWLATTLAGSLYFAYACNVTWLVEKCSSPEARFWVPSMAFDNFFYTSRGPSEELAFNLNEALAAAAQNPSSAPAAAFETVPYPALDQVPLGEQPRSLLEAARLTQYLQWTGAVDPYSVYPHPAKLEELKARQAEFVQVDSLAQSPQFSAGVDLCFAGIDFWGYMLVFTLLAVLCLPVLALRSL
ncbi:MAG: hypothetical protein NTY98_09110 [Verrucomicrobia bacterium]|nr:hypothetical protein [Verrucomicrobiota bacterium]